MKIQTLIDLTIDRARKENAEHVLPEHLACELLLIPEIQASLISFGLKDIEKALYELEAHTRKSVGSFTTNPTPSNMFEIIIKRAIAQALLEGKKTPSSTDVFFSLLKESETSAVKILRKQGLNVDAIISFHLGSVSATTPVAKDKSKVSPAMEKSKIINPKDEVKVGVLTKNLDTFTENYNNLAKNGTFMPCIGREKEIEKIIHTLLRKTKNSILLVGGAGVGKSTIVEGFTRRVVDEQVPDSLKGMKIYSLDVNNIIAGAKHHGSFEERIKNIIDELQLVPNSILFIDELQTIIGAGGSGNLDLATILKIAVSRGKVKIVGCVTEEDYRKYLEKDRALTRRFFKIEVGEPTPDQTKEIVKGVVPTLEKFYDVKILPEAIDTAVDLSIRYMFDRNLPDKSIDLLDSAVARIKLAHKGKKTPNIGHEDIAKEIMNFTKISEVVMSENEKTRLVHLQERLREKIFGQDKAIEKLVDTIYVAKSGLRNSEKTIANLMFQGPTACGKTEMAKQLAKNLGVELVRFDLSAYQDKFTLSALIGSPPGYIGYNDGRAGDGLLINAIEKNPNCVLLLDEVEKAHPDVLNILLQIMDYGMLSSSGGKIVNFRNVILIMTSNIGAELEEKQRIGFGEIDNSDKFEENFKQFFRPEFRSRLDAVVKFNKLGYQQMEQIVRKSFNELVDMTEKFNVAVELSPAALKYLADKAYNNNSGARIVSVLIDEEIKTKLSKILIHEEKPKEKYVVDFVDNSIVVI